MIKLLVNVFWTIVGGVILLGGLVVPGMTIPSIILCLLIFLWRFILYLKSRSKKIGQIPQEILEDFNIVQDLYEKSDGQTEPHEILWQIARKRQKGIQRETSNNVRATDRNMSVQEIIYKSKITPKQSNYKNIFKKRSNER